MREEGAATAEVPDHRRGVGLRCGQKLLFLGVLCQKLAPLSQSTWHGASLFSSLMSDMEEIFKQ